MIQLAKKILTKRKKIAADTSNENHYLILRHQLFLKGLDLFTLVIFASVTLLLLTDIDSTVGINIYIFYILFIMLVAINIIYIKFGSIKWAGTLLSFTVFFCFSTPAFSYIIALNHPTYFLMLLPILALLILGRTALIFSGIISTISTIIILYMHDIDSYNINIIAENKAATISITIYYALVYYLLIYCCSAYERMITNNKHHITNTRKSLFKLSLLDPLLDVYSRKAIQEKFDYLSNHPNPFKQKFSIISINLNNLKKLNDSLGHNFSNDALHIFTTRIKYDLNKTDVVGRVYGGEFVVLKMTNKNISVQSYFEKLIQELCEPITFEGVTTPISVTAGYDIYSKENKSLESQLKSISVGNFSSASNKAANEII